MILESLVGHYEDLIAAGRIEDVFGWSNADISHVLCLNKDGTLTQVKSVMEEVVGKNKSFFRPITVSMPMKVNRSSNIAADFLWGNSAYLLGVSAKVPKKGPDRIIKCFQEFRRLHHELLDPLADNTNAKAILTFLDAWDPKQAPEHPMLQPIYKEILAGNLTFQVDGEYVTGDPDIRAAWKRQFDQSCDGPMMPCIATGRVAPAMLIHPKIMKLPMVQGSGASLVSFNKDSFRSFGFEKSLNAPTSQYGAFAYTEALKHLIEVDKNLYDTAGNTSVLNWAAGGETIYSALFIRALFHNWMKTYEGYSQKDLDTMTAALLKGEPVQTKDGVTVDPEKPFFVLGLSPNMGRISVRFFLHEPFIKVMRNIAAHNQRMSEAIPVTKTLQERDDAISLMKLFDDVGLGICKDPKKKEFHTPPNGVVAETIHAILTNTPYPVSLISQMYHRMSRSFHMTGEKEQSTNNYTRMAILRAYYMQMDDPGMPKEALTTELNLECRDQAYCLGRLFAVFEKVQDLAIYDIQTTIRDRYFFGASATPAKVFPQLIKLNSAHLRKLTKLNPKQYRIYQPQVKELTDIITDNLPLRMSPQQQATFQLGYYHQANHINDKS